MISAIRLPRLHKPDLRLGFALMRDARIPLRSKLLSFVIAFAATGIVEVFEVPVEGVLAAVLPFLGIAGDFAIDGLEAIAGPLLIANLLLPYLAPQEIVARIRAERATDNKSAKSPIIDV
jgi:hypothetical protein